MEDRLTTVKTRKQQELIEIGKLLSTYESDNEKQGVHKIFCKKGANLERQYEDRVQKMLSELREVSRLIANAVIVCYFVFLVDLPVTILKDMKCYICLLFCNNYFVFG